MIVPDNLVYLTVTSAIGLQGWIVKKIFDIETKLAIVTTKQDMKNSSLKKTLAILSLAVIPAIFIGCSTAQTAIEKVGGALSSIVLRSVDAVSTATNIIPRQEIVEQSLAVRNDAGIVVSNLVTYTTNTTLVTNLVLLTNQVYEVKPALANTVATIKAAEPFIPAPYGTVVDAALAGFSLLSGWMVNRRNKQKVSLENQLTAVVEGVEKAADQFPEAAKVKANIANAALNHGVSVDLHKFVQSIT